MALALAATACGDLPVAPAPDGAEPVLAAATRAIDDAGSFQAALDAAALSPAPSVIRLSPSAEIHLTAPLTWTGSAALHVQGRSATLYGPAAGTALEATGGGDLRLEGLAVVGAGEHGVYVEVPAHRTGTLSIRIDDVILEANGFSGLWIDDQVHDSPAGLDVGVRRSRILGNNTAGLGSGTDLAALADKDGIRVNEGGVGDLVLEVHDSWFEGNEADGLELDETGPGDVRSTVRHTSFVDNGAQQQFPEDLEDGFDIDEADDGSIHATFVDVYVTGHLDEGVDLDELGAGSVYASMTRVQSIRNRDDNISITESEEVDTDATVAGEGDIVIDFRGVDASEGDRNGDGDGIKLEEFGTGDITGRIVQARVLNNDDDGLQVDESGPGGGLLRLQAVQLEGNLDDDLDSEVDVVIVP